MAALIEASRQPGYPGDVVVVVSNDPEAGGLNIARGLDVPVAAIDHRPFGKDRDAHERALEAVLIKHQVEVVVLAGYMRLLTPGFVGRWAGRMVNIHPSLLPLYPGLDTHARAIAAGDAEAGCTVHVVTEGVDDGPILGQARVPVLDDDTALSLAERVKVAEHDLYPRVLADFLQRKTAPA